MDGMDRPKPLHKLKPTTPLQLLTAMWMLLVIPMLAIADNKDQIAQAKALFDNGQARGAYRLLLPLEKEYAGLPEFDYMLGISALDGDEPGYAVVALQRVIAVQPLFVGARIDLARSYFYLREFDAAREEFETVLRFNPPGVVRELVVHYLDEIYKRQQGNRSHFSYALHGSAGSDSNANSATDATSYLGFELGPASRKFPSNYFSVGALANYAYQASSRSTLYIGADVRDKHYQDANFVNTRIFSGNMSMNYFGRSYSINLGSQAFYTLTDGQYQTYNGVVLGQLQFMLGKYLKTALTGRAAVAEYLGELSDQDSMSGLGSISIGMVRDVGIIPAIDLSIFAGKSIARTPGSPYGNDHYGARATGIKPINNKLRLIGSTGAGWTRYDGLFSGNVRNERRLDATASIEWRPTKSFSISPSASYVYNTSTIVLYAYDKLDYHLNIRKDF